VVSARDLGAVYGLSGDEIERAVRKEFRAYRATLRDDQRHLLERFELVDVARKVVGVGSVGTRAFIALLQGRERDMKGSAEVETMAPVGLTFYAGICGWTLARAHARSGDPVAISEYLGENDQFDRSITDFARRYADQNERDYQAFADAVRSGRLAMLEGL
jgi:Uncharacterized protein conserved in bacteria (DUF2252)